MGWLDSSADGFSSAQAAELLAHHDPNVIRTHHISALAVLGRQFQNAVLILLVVTAVARRDGTSVAVDVTNLVPGDMIRLSLGEAVPADVRLIETTALECDESIL